MSKRRNVDRDRHDQEDIISWDDRFLKEALDRHLKETRELKEKPEPEKARGSASRKEHEQELSGKGEGAEYRVGYGRPPLHSRIKRGEVRNPKGRPLGSKNRIKPKTRDVIQAAVVRYEKWELRQQQIWTNRAAQKLLSLAADIRRRFEDHHVRIDVMLPIGAEEGRELRRLLDEEINLKVDLENMIQALEEARGTAAEQQIWPTVNHLERLLVQNRFAQHAILKKQDLG